MGFVILGTNLTMSKHKCGWWPEIFIVIIRTKSTFWRRAQNQALRHPQGVWIYPKTSRETLEGFYTAGWKWSDLHFVRSLLPSCCLFLASFQDHFYCFLLTTSFPRTQRLTSFPAHVFTTPTAQDSRQCGSNDWQLGWLGRRYPETAEARETQWLIRNRVSYWVGFKKPSTGFQKSRQMMPEIPSSLTIGHL